MGDTKSELLATALRLFASEGYENVGTQKIVETAQVKKPTLYYHFGSKQGLLEAVLQDTYGPFLEGLQAKSVYNGDLTLILETLTAHYFAFAREHAAVYRWGLALGYAPAQSEACLTMLPFLTRQVQLLTQVFEAAAVQHGNLRGRSQSLSLSFLGMINAAITRAFYEQIPLETYLDTQQAFQSCKQFMHGIYAG
jgi:TetR/AcrR family transcriptional regulator